MAKDKARKISRLAAVAAAVAAVVPLGAAVQAQAAPDSCKQWAFTGPTNITLSTGPTVTFSAVGRSFSGVPATDNRSDHGTMEGVVTPIGTVTLLYRSETFPNDPVLHLMGSVGDDGRASGQFDAKLRGDWAIATPLACETPAAAAQGNSREVTGDVDAYDAPGGTGTVIGVLQGGEGQRVNLAAGCKEDNWCNVVWDQPPGTAWVWGDFLK
jgi:hypothetical protein